MDKELMRQYIRKLDKAELIDLFIRHLRPREEAVRIPVSIFNERLSCLESVVKYLREEQGYSNAKVGKLLMRSCQTVWITYRNSWQKHQKPLKVTASVHDIPLETFATKGSVLEATVKYLRDKGLNYREIAGLIRRNVKTVTTVYYRAKGGRP